MKLPSPSPRFLLELWERTRHLPGGKLLFNRALALAVPYSATIGAELLELRPGLAKVCMSDRRRIRNHLNSIHAMALANLAELASGLALNTGLPEGRRAILTAFTIEYLKKARGTLTAESETPLPDSLETLDWTVNVITKDTSGDIVSSAKATWRISS